MGGSWLKSLISVKKPPSTITDQSEDNRVGSNKKKWKLWRSSSEGVPSSRSKGVRGAGSERSSDSSSLGDDTFAAAIATLARAPPRDFRMVKQEWAAIRIQAAFRGLLARRACRALRAVVRIQAIFRGQQVRKQAAVTLRCMQALVRVQARVRARTVKISSEGQSMLDEYCNSADPSKQVEQGWCNSPGTVDEVRAKMQMRQEGAMKRERALAYALSQQARACSSPLRRTNKAAMPLKHQMPDNSTASWTWLDRWMANKPWESSPGNTINAQLHKISSETPFSRKSEDNIAAFYSDMAKHDGVKVRKNGVTTKVLARPPAVIRDVLQSYSAPSSETFHDESSASTSSNSASPVPLSSNTLSIDKAVEENYNRKPSYMNPTESIMAKQQKSSWYSAHKMHRHLMDDQLHTRSMELCGGDTRSTGGSHPSFSVSCDLYPPVPIGRQDDIKVRRPTGRQA